MKRVMAISIDEEKDAKLRKMWAERVAKFEGKRNISFSKFVDNLIDDGLKYRYEKERKKYEI